MALLALPVFLLCLPAACWGLVLAVRGLAERSSARVWRGLAWVFVAVGVGVYAAGIAFVGLAQAEASHGTGASPAPACWQANLGPVKDHRAGYFHLRFDCLMEDGTTRSPGVVSAWLTPVSAVLLVVGVGLSVTRRRYFTLT